QPGDSTAEDEDDSRISSDPFELIAWAAGFSDSERWWEQMVEQRGDTENLFAAIQELMRALREHPHPDFEKRDRIREAWMRQRIRAAEKEGFERIAVVCGAWHGPALEDMPPAKQDNAILKDL